MTRPSTKGPIGGRRRKAATDLPAGNANVGGPNSTGRERFPANTAFDDVQRSAFDLFRANTETGLAAWKAAIDAPTVDAAWSSQIRFAAELMSTNATGLRMLTDATAKWLDLSPTAKPER